MTSSASCSAACSTPTSSTASASRRPCRRSSASGSGSRSGGRTRRSSSSAPGSGPGIPIRYDDPREVGPDRIVNAVAAKGRYGAPVIVVDFGTSTNFDVVSPAGEYVGGVLAPGIEISMEALFARAARLVKVDYVAPATRDREDDGRRAASRPRLRVRGSGRRDRRRASGASSRRRRRRVIATGGLAELVAPHSATIERVDPFLTLDGLRLVWELNAVTPEPRHASPSSRSRRSPSRSCPARRCSTSSRRASTADAGAGVVSALGVSTGGMFHVRLPWSGSRRCSPPRRGVHRREARRRRVPRLARDPDALCSRDDRIAGRAPSRRSARTYRQGVVVNVLNPKTALFFLAFLPQFVDPDGSTRGQLAVLGAACSSLIALATDLVWALVAGTAGAVLRQQPALPARAALRLGDDLHRARRRRGVRPARTAPRRSQRRMTMSLRMDRQDRCRPEVLHPRSPEPSQVLVAERHERDVLREPAPVRTPGTDGDARRDGSCGASGQAVRGGPRCDRAPPICPAGAFIIVARNPAGSGKSAIQPCTQHPGRGARLRGSAPTSNVAMSTTAPRSLRHCSATGSAQAGGSGVAIRIFGSRRPSEYPAAASRLRARSRS